METKCFNKNSVFYKNLVDHGFTFDEIAQINDKIEQEKFIKWYGEGKLDSFNQPVIIDKIYIVNDNGEKITLNDLLNDEFYNKRQFYAEDLTHMDKIKDFLEEERIGVVRRISAHRGSDYTKRLRKLLEDIDALEKGDYFNALNLHAEYILSTVADLELKFYELDKSKTKVEGKELKNLLINANYFLQTFSKIRNLDSPVNRTTKEAEIINSLKKAEDRVTALQTKVYGKIESEVRNTLSDLISNPQVKNGVIDFLAAQTDESKVQLFLDALGDSHVTFIAAIDKFYKRNMFDAEEEIKEKIKEWDSIVAKDPTVFDRIIDKENGRLIQEYDDGYYDQLSTFTGKLKAIKDRNSKEYKDLQDQFFNWKLENTEQQYVKEYYKALKNLHPKAREAKEAIDILKKKILAKGKAKLNIDDLTQLQDLEDQMKALKSTIDANDNKKTGEALEIANSLFQYSKTINSFYDTLDIDELRFNKAKKQAEEKGEEYLADWLKHNTVETFTDDFWNFFNNHIKNFPRSEDLTKVEDEIKQLLLTYKNEKGEVIVEDLPPTIRAEYNTLYERKKAIKEYLNSTMDMITRAKLQREFNKHIEFIPTTEYVKTLAEKRKFIEDLESTQGPKSKVYLKAKKDFDRWYAINHETNIYTGESSPISIWTKMRPKNKKFIIQAPNSRWKITGIKPEFHNPKYKEDTNGYPSPADKWRNSTYDNLAEQDRTSLAEVKKLLLYLTEHIQNDMIKKGFIPAIPNSARSAKDNTKSNDYTNKAITEANEIVQFIPFKFIRKLNQQPLPQFQEGATEEENKKVEEERAKIIAENRKAHGAAINNDLNNTMRQFIKVAITNKYKHEMELDILLFKEQMKRQKIRVTDAKGKPILDKVKSAIKGESVEHEVDASSSNMLKHFNEWLEGVFYEQFEHDEGWLSDWADKVQSFASLRSLGLNVLSAVNNSLIGNLQVRIESSGGQYFKAADYRKARWEYFANVTHFIANQRSDKTENKADAFQKYFDVLISQDELSDKAEGALKTMYLKAKQLKDKAFFAQHIGEHQIQNTALFAMAYSHRIVDGKIVTFNEYFEKSRLQPKWNRKMTEEEVNREMEIISKNYELRNALEEEFKKFPTVYDSFEVKDGYLTPKEDAKIDKDEIFNFKQRIIGINQRLHGIYNTEDAAMIQRYALGRLAMQFRKWMRPGWNRRFGRRFFKKDYNERIRDYEEGMYVSTFRFLTSPFTTNYKAIKAEEKRAAMIAYKTLVEGMRDTFSNAKIRWHSLSEMEKANIRRTGVEFMFLLTVLAIGFFAMNMKGDDDDKLLTFTLYQADRLFGELTTFTPAGIVREGNRLFKSPSPVFNTLEDVMKFSYNVIAYPFRDEEDRLFKNGIYYKEDKIAIYGKDLLPFYTQLQRIEYMNENTQRYGFFR